MKEHFINWVFRFDDIELDKLVPTQDFIDETRVRQFTEVLINEPDYEFPPIQCSQSIFEDDKKFYISNGHHRNLAYRLAGRKTIPAEMLIRG